MTLIAVTLSVITVSITDLQDAEAAKISGTYTQKFGSATKDKVCGDQLCVDISQKQIADSCLSLNSIHC